MIKQELLNKLKNEYKIIRFKPLYSTFDYEYKSTPNGTFTFENTNTKFFKKLPVEIITENLYTAKEESIGKAMFYIVNPSIYEDDAITEIVNYDNLSTCLMVAMDYLNHENSYEDYHFIEPYQPFIILSGLYIKNNFRKYGIGTELIKYAPELINEMFNLNTTHVFWRSWPVDECLRELKTTTEDNLMELSNFAGSFTDYFFYGPDDEDFEYRYYIKEDI